VTVFGSSGLTRVPSYSAVFTNVSASKGGTSSALPLSRSKVKDLTLHKDGTVTVDFAIDKGLTLTEGTRAAVRYRKPHRRPLSVPRRRAGLGAETATGTDDPAGTDFARARRRRSHRWLPALVRALDPDQVNALVPANWLNVLPGQAAPSRQVLARPLH